jgi:heme/copper-type cytochrome/quinol oxidase subunit 2
MSRRRRCSYALYSSFLFILSTILLVVIGLQGQLMWIIYRDQIQPLEYQETSYSSYVLETISDVIPITILFLDGILLVGYSACYWYTC